MSSVDVRVVLRRRALLPQLPALAPGAPVVKSAWKTCVVKFECGHRAAADPEDPPRPGELVACPGCGADRNVVQTDRRNW
jgi:hypothetical protein